MGTKRSACPVAALTPDTRRAIQNTASRASCPTSTVGPITTLAVVTGPSGGNYGFRSFVKILRAEIDEHHPSEFSKKG